MAMNLASSIPNLTSTAYNFTIHPSNRTSSNPNYVCTSPLCIFNAAALSLISISGMIANAVVLLVIRADKRLHQPTFVVIFGLAVSDFSFLVARYIRFIIDSYFGFNMPYDHYRYVKITLDFIGLVGAASSVIHLMLLSLLRYYSIVHPLEAHAKLTTGKTMIATLPVWIASFVISSVYLFAVIINRSDKKLQTITNFVVTMVMSISPIVVLAGLHILKAKSLLKSLSTTEETVRKMSRVITFVICCYFITTTPSNVLDVLNLTRHPFTKTMTFYEMAVAFRILLFLNYAVNPFIYFIFSPQFKRFFKELYGRILKHPKKRASHSHSGLSQSTRLTEMGQESRGYQTVASKPTSGDDLGSKEETFSE